MMNNEIAINSIKSKIANALMNQSINEDAIDLIDICANIMHFLAFAIHESIYDSDDYDNACDYSQLHDDIKSLMQFDCDIRDEMREFGY